MFIHACDLRDLAERRASSDDGRGLDEATGARAALREAANDQRGIRGRCDDAREVLGGGEFVKDGTCVKRDAGREVMHLSDRLRRQREIPAADYRPDVIEGE